MILARRDMFDSSNATANIWSQPDVIVAVVVHGHQIGSGSGPGIDTELRDSSIVYDRRRSIW